MAKEVTKLKLNVIDTEMAGVPDTVVADYQISDTEDAELRKFKQINVSDLTLAEGIDMSSSMTDYYNAVKSAIQTSEGIS